MPVGCGGTPSVPIADSEGKSPAPTRPEQEQEAKRQLRMGYDALKRQELDTALSCADEALRQDTKEDPALTAKALVLRSLVYSYRKDFDRAVSEAAAAIEAKKDAPYGYFARARAYEWKELYQEAADDLTKAIELTPVGPEQAQYYELRAKCRKELGQREKAREDERRAKDLAKDG
jgi:tetratricopeptide (TPR) repeat protein